MKKFLIINFILINSFITPNIFACDPSEPTYNYYMFSVLSPETSIFSKTNNFWINYIHSSTKDDIESIVNDLGNFIPDNLPEYLKIEAKKDSIFYNEQGNLKTPIEFKNSQNKIIKYARIHKDYEMMQYLNLLNEYLYIIKKLNGDWNDNEWAYPSKKEKIYYSSRLKAINNASIKYKGNALKANYAVLTMRTFFMLKDFDSCKKFWNDYASKLPASPLKDIITDFYAGALLKTGNKQKAYQLYAEINDISSIKLCMQEYINFKSIKKIYINNPNSKVLPFLIQNFVNNAQETIDSQEDNIKEIDTTDPQTIIKNYSDYSNIDTIYKKEIINFINFANKVVADNKTKTPMLWKSAAGTLNYLRGEQKLAIKELDDALKLNGSQRMKDNTQAIKLIVSVKSAKESKDYDNYIFKGIQWLYEKAKNESNDKFNNHYFDILERLVYNNLYSKYNSWNRTNTATALIGMVENLPITEKSYIYNQTPDTSVYFINNNYSTKHFSIIDTMNVENLTKYYKYIYSSPKDSLDHWIINYVYKNENYYNDLIGTKLMRINKFKDAKKYLTKVPISFLDSQNIATYMAYRKYSIEPWFTHQYIPEYAFEKHINLKSNPKLTFCKEMIKLQSKLNNNIYFNKNKRQNSAYNLAIRYYQASYAGECWFLTQYSQSCNDSVRNNEEDFIKLAAKYLNVSKQDPSIKEKSLFALVYIPYQPNSDNELNDESQFENSEKVMELNVDLINKLSLEQKAIMELLAYVKTLDKPADYITNCDYLKYFE